MSTSTYSNLDKIFPGFIENTDISEDELYNVQLNYLLSMDLSMSINSLINNYSLCPKAVISTILFAFDSNIIQNFGEFPYQVLIKSFRTQQFNTISCIEALCEANKNIFVNLLYRIAQIRNNLNYRGDLDLLGMICSFKNCEKYFEDPEIWGLGRSKACVVDQDDIWIQNVLNSTNMDIEFMGYYKLGYFKAKSALLDKSSYEYYLIQAAMKTPGVELIDVVKSDSAEDINSKIEKNMELCVELKVFNEQIKNFEFTNIKSLEYKAPCQFEFKTIGLYKLPCFLYKILSFYPKSEDFKTLRFEMNVFHENISCIIKNLIKNVKMKNNFENLILNILKQDRIKEVYDKSKNCTDELVYNLTFVLLEIACGIFKPNFIVKIGVSNFATYCFFNLMRMFEIYVCKRLRLADKSGDEPDLEFKMINLKSGRIINYIEFIFDVIEKRESEFYSILNVIIEEQYPNQNLDVNGIVKLVEARLENKKSTKVSEILCDEGFISGFLILQLFFSKSLSFKSINFLSKLLIYKNNYQLHLLRIFYRLLDLKQNYDIILIRRLIRSYTDKSETERYEERHYINKILMDVYVDINHDVLRMGNAMVSDMETNMSNLLDTIIKIKGLKCKCLMLEQLIKKEVIDEEISDNEYTGREQFGSGMLEYLSMLSDLELREYARQLVSRNRMERLNGYDSDVEIDEHRLYLFYKSEIMRIKDPLRYKVDKKLKITRSHILSTEKILRSQVQLLLSYLNVLNSFIKNNKKLFLNRNIFYKLCNILNGCLNNLLGKERNTYKLKDGSKYKYNPRDLLVLLLNMVINLLGTNEKLISRSELSAEILQTGYEICKSKFIIASNDLLILSNIITVIKNTVSVVQEDENIPEKFLDPLTYNVMEHPIRITTSNVIIDRSTFNQIMLNDGTDPFSRLPLDETKCEPCEELEAEIEEYFKK